MMIPMTLVQEAHASGLCVVPPAQDGTKRPQPPGADPRWKQFQQQPPSLALLKSWYDPRNGLTGIGVVTGKVSGNLEAIDFDTRAGWEAYYEMADYCGVKPLIDRVLAGYGEESPRGAHLLYRCPVIAGNSKLARDAAGKAFIESRGEGGYLIIAPSNGAVHPSGGEYRRVSGSLATIASISEVERNDLWELAKSMDLHERRPDAGVDPIQSSADPSNRPGEDFNRRATWSDVLVPHGWTRVFTRGDVTYWRRPGKKEGISATTGFSGTDYLYVFTTSTGLDSERAYTKFSVFALLEHGGDFRAATRALSQSGYGEQPRKPNQPGAGEQPRKPNPLTLPAMVRMEEQPRKPNPPLIPIADYIALPKSVHYLVKGVLPARGLAQLFGDSNVGKSFIAIDLGCHIAAGMDWRGFRVKKTGVVYIAAEGLAGLQARFAAWCQQTGCVPDNFWIREYPVGLTSVAAAELVAEQIRELGVVVGLVILDTFAGNFGVGSENDVADMSAALTGMKIIGAERTVLNIHHTGHTEKTRARGHSSLFAAIDVELLISRQGEDGVISVSHTKVRDFERMAPLAFRLETVALPWLDDDGEPVNSAMAIPADALPDETITDRPLSRKQAQAMELLRVMYERHGANCGGSTPRVLLRDWYSEMDFETDRSHRSRLLRELEKRHLVYVDSGYVYIS